MPSPVANSADVRRRVDEIRWFHRIDLGNGIVTPGADDTPAKLKALHLPSLAGKTVLDIGANDGFFSFHAERAGASRVVAVDSPAWGDEPWGSKAGFNTAREILGSKVEDVQSDFFDLDPAEIGTFDVVFFLGVLYHVEDPMAALRKVMSLTNELLVLETVVDATWTRRPAAAFYPTTELGGDETNWWGPNPAAIIGMLKAIGFREAIQVGKRSLAGRIGHSVYNAANIAHSRIDRSRPSLTVPYIQTDRAVFHARR